MPVAARSAWIAFFVAGLIASMPPCLTVAQDRRGAFTAPPRSVRSRDIDQQHVRLDLKFNMDAQRIDATATHQLTLFKPVQQITLDAAELKIVSCALKTTGVEKPVDLRHELRGQALTMFLGKEYPAEARLELIIAYQIEKPRHGAHFVVPDESEPDQPKMVWTQSEPELARYWYPCFDSPSDRLTSEILATVPSSFVTLSNGLLQEKKDNPGGTSTWHWVQSKTHVPYLLSLVAGDFEVLEQKWNDLPVQSFVPRGRRDEAALSFDKTPRMVDYFSQRIGLKYPWEKYSQICVDEYQWGGMEHTSATTLTLRTLHDSRAHLDVSSDNLVAHELAHQWWGDLITCKDWGELWLNESFATYFATLWTEHDEGWDEAAWARREEANSYLDEDKRYRRPIVTYRYPRPEAMFDRHTYPKGGRVLHMLRFVLGDEAYWKAIRRYAEVNQFRTVETADLRRAIEESTGQGLNWFFDQWVYRGGHPEFTTEWSWDEATKNAVLTIKQTQKVDELTPLFRMPVEIEIGHGTSSQVRRIEINKAEETYHFALDARPTRLVFDPRDWLLKTLKSSKSKEEWIDQLVNCQHVMAKTEAVAGLAEYKEHGDALDALLKTAKEASFWGVRKEAVKILASLNKDPVRIALIEAARKDGKSFVRREALSALGSFAHDDARTALRQAIAEDQSYYAVADALKSLVKIDRDKSQEALLAALQTPGHQEVILRAACDGLVDLKAKAAIDLLSAKLKGKLRPDERAVIIGALARLDADEPEHLAHLKKELENDRNHVRRTAIESFVALGDSQAIEWLQDRRGREETQGMVQRIDEAIEKLRSGQKPAAQTREEIEKLRKQNRELEERLKKLEETK